MSAAIDLRNTPAVKSRTGPLQTVRSATATTLAIGEPSCLYRRVAPFTRRPLQRPSPASGLGQAKPLDARHAFCRRRRDAQTLAACGMSAIAVLAALAWLEV
jgi:hypothetical protein